MGSTIEGATEQVRWVCDGCGRSMLRSSIKRHLSWCPKNAVSKRCPTCVHNTWERATCKAGVVRDTKDIPVLWDASEIEVVWIDGPCEKWEARNG